MSRVLLAGIGPLPSEGRKQLFAPGLRVWIFARTLVLAGHEVRLALGAFAGQEGPLSIYDVEKDASGEAVARRLAAGGEESGLPQAIARAAADFRAQCLVATTDAMAEAAVCCGANLPLWVDFYGSPMAERQQQAAMHGNDGGLAAAWRTILGPLLGADHFSACSEPQRLALIGELGACGRLNRLTAGHDLADVIPPAALLSPLRAEEPFLRASIVPQEAFVVLWSGGFNTWTDIETLHSGLIQAMRRDGRIHFVSTGGAIPGHCEMVYPQFQHLVETGPLRDRFHLLGWIDLDKVRQAWAEADLAVNVDAFSYEGLLGTRTRLLDWMEAQLPFATTPLCELSRMLIRRSLAREFHFQDPGSLATAIVEASAGEEATREMARRAHAFLQAEWTHAKLLAPLLEWVQNPAFAPDLACAKSAASGEHWAPENSLAFAQQQAAETSKLRDEMEALRARHARLNAHLARLQGSRLVRAWMRLKGIAVAEAEKELPRKH